jgi:endonuclease VIII
MAGPGNVYANEVCFLRGLHPATPVGSVADPAALVDLMKRVMDANRTLGRQVTTGDTRHGRDRWVYGRRGEPCRRCGTPIRRVAGGEDRVRYWCPACQPGPDGEP